MRIEKTRWSVGWLAASLGLALASGSAAVSWMERVEVAQRIGALSDLEGYVEVLRQRVAEGEFEPVQARYDLAFAAWRINHVLYAYPDRVGERTVWLESAQQQLDWILERQPDHVEALALRGAVLGELAGASWLSRIRLGTEAKSTLDRAHALAPENPRVALQRGIQLMHSPGFVGGGPEPAVRELRRALVLLEGEAKTAAWPNWGHTDAYAWLGQALAELGETAEARRVYRLALAEEPASLWIQAELMPALDR